MEAASECAPKMWETILVHNADFIADTRASVKALFIMKILIGLAISIIKN
uniref:Uncharacterized protein n=1 Tax=Manihot esculenta TaxID=3983 RepID=A0A2C9VVW3_MANES